MELKRKKLCVAIVLVLVGATIGMIGHECIHMIQCWMVGGDGRFGTVWSKGYDFFEFEWGDVLPSPCVWCRYPDQESFDRRMKLGDISTEFPAWLFTLGCMGLFELYTWHVLGRMKLKEAVPAFIAPMSSTDDIAHHVPQYMSA
jgi:hypothetical protein